MSESFFDNIAGDRSVKTISSSSGSPAVRVCKSDFRFCSTSESGPIFFFDQRLVDAPARRQDPDPGDPTP